MGIVHPGVPRRLALWLRDEAATSDFVGTGTYRTGTARWAATHFDRVISIEADEELHSAAGKRLASYANVDLRLGRSQDVLATLVPKLSRPALAWLDDHWSGDNSQTAARSGEQEMQASEGACVVYLQAHKPPHAF
jgi:hypothetical protein